MANDSPEPAVAGSGRPWRDPRVLWLVVLNCIGISCAIVTQLLDRDMVNEDGLSYLEMGLQTAQGGWSHLVNLYWSPLYPAILACGFSVFRPEPAHSGWVVHGVNALLVACASVACTWFSWNWLRLHAGLSGLAGRAARFCLAATFIYGIFLWALFRHVTMSTCTPDALVMAIALTAAAWCCGLGMWPVARWRFVVFGVILGLGFWAKAAMLPVSVGFLAVTVVCPPARRTPRRYLALSAAALALTAAPLLILMSREAGRFSVGEAGRINVAWFVRHVHPFAGWTGEKPGWAGEPQGTPTHPPRTVCEKPLALEFAGPVRATYPLWFAPAYWYDGVDGRFRGWQIMRGIIERNSRRLWKALNEPALLGWGLLAVLLLRLGDWKDKRLPWRSAWLAGWAAAGTFVYLPVVFEARYAGAPVVFFWVAAYTLLASAGTGRWQQAVMCIVAVLIAAPDVRGHWMRIPTARLALAGRHNEGWPLRAARDLERAGLQRGQPVATVGYSFDAYWAHVAGLRIIAQVLDDRLFWSLPAQRRDKIEELLRRTGARAIVAKQKDAACDCPRWRLAGPSGMVVRRFLESEDTELRRMDVSGLREACEFEPNLIPNGSLDTGIEGWDGGRGEVRPHRDCYRGSCIEFRPKADGSQYVVAWGAVRLQPSREYVLTAWIKSVDDRTLPLDCGMWDSAVSRWVATQRFDATAEWKQVRVEFRNGSSNPLSPIFWEALPPYGRMLVDEVTLLEKPRN